jgi:mycobactin lysine-N-oxygenase
VTTGRSYWQHEPRPGPHLAQSICVIGSGETAASIVIDLLRRAHKRSTVDVVTSRGVLYSRGESYAENRLYSDPGDWPALAETHRREFLERTDRGVFSVQAEAVLNASRRFRTLAGRAVAIDASDHQVLLTTEYGAEQEKVAYDFVVVAIGFESRWFESLLGPDGRSRLTAALAGELLDKQIGTDLAVAGLTPALHLPMLAGLAQGPGFPNLSCLGLLSDRVLSRYVPRPPDDPPDGPVASALERSEHV